MIFHLILILTQDYVKFELPPKQPITVSIGVDVKDIPKVFQNIHFIHYIWTKSKVHGFWLQVSDKDFSITLNAYFIVKWSDSRWTEYNISVGTRAVDTLRGQGEKRHTGATFFPGAFLKGALLTRNV